jgi:uncharacterized protein (DUF433 family)
VTSDPSPGSAGDRADGGHSRRVRGPHDREVVPLYRPKPGVAVDPEIRGGYPVIAGTRVPYDMVASLLNDGVTAEEVTGFYPAVSATAAQGALTFARYVDGYREPVGA